jgi:hypothetical protein
MFVNNFCFLIYVCILADIIILAIRLHRIENFKNKFHITRIGNGNTSLEANQCLVQIITTEDQFDSTQSELTKMIKTFSNAPINAFQNRINQNSDVLFINYVIKFDDVKRITNSQDSTKLDSARFDNNRNRNVNNQYNDIQPNIHFITRQNNFRLDGLINENDNAYNIIMKLIGYIGLSTNYQ